jgi:hypothetical protein
VPADVPDDSIDPNDSIDPDDCGLPSSLPLPSEMPSSWWTPLLFGEPGDAVSPEDAHLCLALIEARLGEYQDSGRSIKRDPGTNVSVGNELPATVGVLHERIEQLYGSRGWRVFQQLYHEAAGVHPRRKTVGSVDVVTKGDARPVNC